MTREEASAKAVRHWLDRAKEALASAEAERSADRLAFAVNRCYFAAFYAASAALLHRGQSFVKHSGVRAAVHRQLVKPGLLSHDLGRQYAKLHSSSRAEAGCSSRSGQLSLEDLNSSNSKL